MTPLSKILYKNYSDCVSQPSSHLTRRISSIRQYVNKNIVYNN